MPYTVQFIARVVLIDVARLEQLIIAQGRIIQPVAVIGNVHFLLPFQLPVVAVRCAIEHIQVIRGALAVRGCTRPVIGHLRRPAHPALTRVVDPGPARLLHLVNGLVHQQYVTGQAGRRADRLLEVEQDVGILARLVVLKRCLPGQLLIEVDRRIIAILLGHGLMDVPVYRTATIAGDVVPDHLKTVFRNRERHRRIEVLETITALNESGIGGVLLCLFVDPLRQSRRAAGLVDRHLVVFVLVDHLHLTW